MASPISPGLRPRIVPKRTARQRVERENLVRTGDIQHAVRRERRRLQAEVRIGKTHFNFSDETFAVVICFSGL